MKTIDISSKLTNERPRLKLAEGLEFEIDNSKNTVLKVQQKMVNSTDGEVIDTAIEALLGKDAVKKIDKMNLSVESYKTIFIALMASISDISYEEAEERFRTEGK